MLDSRPKGMKNKLLGNAISLVKKPKSFINVTTVITNN